MDGKKYLLPSPIVNKREEESLTTLTRKYEKLISPGPLKKASNKIADVTPEKLKEIMVNAKMSISEAELYAKCMDEVAKGFSILEQQAAKLSISEASILKKVNETTKKNEIISLDEICFAREYDIAKIVSKYKTQDLALALAEGAGTGAAGFAGIPFNIVLSTFLFFRAVQSIAMFYGYDTKNNPDELVIASDVFMNALNPSSSTVNATSSMIGKVMVMTETTIVKQTVAKSWTEMAERGGICLLITQIRALAHKSAQKALEKAGQKGLEETMFKGVLEQLGKKLTQKTVGTAMPFIGAFIGGLFDISQMNKVLEYADIFYRKRFILEKEVRINQLIDGRHDEVIDIDFSVINEE